MNEYEKDIKKYKEAVKTIYKTREKYKILCSWDNTDSIALKIKFIEKTGIRMQDLDICCTNGFILRVVYGSYKLTNVTTHARLVCDEPYILLENGNIGRYSFVNGVYYHLINEEWENFRSELDKIAIEYDSLNDYWLFEPSVEIVNKIKNIIKDTQEKVNIKVKEEHKKQLIKELEELNKE